MLTITKSLHTFVLKFFWKYNYVKVLFPKFLREGEAIKAVKTFCNFQRSRVEFNRADAAED